MPKSKTLSTFKSIREFIEKTAGEEAVELIKMDRIIKKPFNDELIAKKMNVKVTNVRTLLNRLHYRGITNYEKTRDKKTGWYYYVWTIDIEKIINTVIGEQIEAMDFLENKKTETKDYSLFGCKNCESVPFEVAMEYDFKCPTCGETMDAIDQKEQNKKIQKEIRKYKKEIEALKTLIKKKK